MHTGVKIHVLPGGILPQRQTEGAVGFDVCIRAIVCPHTKPDESGMRKTLFDFETIPEHTKTALHVWHDDEGKLVYRMDPHESVMVGIGFTTEMPFPMFYQVIPRSGFASRWNIDVRNVSSAVDPDYRGEAGVLVYNRNPTPFDLYHGMRIAQVVFLSALIPEFTPVDSAQDLSRSQRGVNGFGSTGIR